MQDLGSAKFVLRVQIEHLSRDLSMSEQPARDNMETLEAEHMFFFCTRFAEWKCVSTTVPRKTLGQDFWAAETFGADRDGVANRKHVGHLLAGTFRCGLCLGSKSSSPKKNSPKKEHNLP